MDQEIWDKYNCANADLREMIDAFQDDAQFKRKYSNFVESAASTLEYIKRRYSGRKNSEGKRFDDWLHDVKKIKNNKGDVELTHLIRARGHDFHQGPIPIGATRSIGFTMDVIIAPRDPVAKSTSEKTVDSIAKPVEK